MIALILALSSPALADVTTPTGDPVDPERCAGLDEGDACTTVDGDDGTCDVDGNCIVEDTGCGCSVGSPLAAGGAVLLALGLLAARRRA